MTDQELEFEHIYLEIKAERWTQIERFLFNYFCYREDYVTSKGKPDWEAARSQAPRSENVMTLSESALEPLVPLTVIIGEIKRYWRDEELTPSTLFRLLDSLLHYVVINKSELAALKKAGLQNTMPASWFQSETREPLARFNEVEIYFAVTVSRR